VRRKQKHRLTKRSDSTLPYGLAGGLWFRVSCDTRMLELLAGAGGCKATYNHRHGQKYSISSGALDVVVTHSHSRGVDPPCLQDRTHSADLNFGHSWKYAIETHWSEDRFHQRFQMWTGKSSCSCVT
jgi:hypothetical protein